MVQDNAPPAVVHVGGGMLLRYAVDQALKVHAKGRFKRLSSFDSAGISFADFTVDPAERARLHSLIEKWR